MKKNTENPRWVILIQKNGQQIVGYTFGFDLSEKIQIQPNYLDHIKFIDDKVKTYIRENLENIFYWQHIGVIVEKGGNGKKLAEQIMETISKLGKASVLGEICEGPIPNNKALAFHKNVSKMDRIGQYHDTKYSINWGVYLRKFKNENL